MTKGGYPFTQDETLGSWSCSIATGMTLCLLIWRGLYEIGFGVTVGSVTVVILYLEGVYDYHPVFLIRSFRKKRGVCL